MSALTASQVWTLCLSVFVIVSADQRNITAESGQNVTLTCRAPNSNIVKWSRADLGDEYVFLYQDGHFDLDNQHPSFKNRVDLQDRQMKDGDMSLILKDVTVNDTGTYECGVFMEQTGLWHFSSTNLTVVDPPEYLISTTVAISTTKSDLECFHDVDAFSASQYKYLLIFMIICKLGALAVFHRCRTFRRSANCVVMMNLAISDGSFSLLLMLRLAYYFSDWMCRLCVFGFYVNLYTSILFLTLLSVQRWLAITQRHYYFSKATPARTLLICLAVWVFVGGSSVPFLSNGITHRNNGLFCFEPYTPKSCPIFLVLNYMTLIFGFLIPLLTIIICYSKILRKLTVKSRFRMDCTWNQRCLVLSVTMAIFLIFFLPYHLVRSLHMHAMCNRWNCNSLLALQKGVMVAVCLSAPNGMVLLLLLSYYDRTLRKSLSTFRTVQKQRL